MGSENPAVDVNELLQAFEDNKNAGQILLTRKHGNFDKRRIIDTHMLTENQVIQALTDTTFDPIAFDGLWSNIRQKPVYITNLQSTLSALQNSDQELLGMIDRLDNEFTITNQYFSSLSEMIEPQNILANGYPVVDPVTNEIMKRIVLKREMSVPKGVFGVSMFSPVVQCDNIDVGFYRIARVADTLELFSTNRVSPLHKIVIGKSQVTIGDVNIDMNQVTTPRMNVHDFTFDTFGIANDRSLVVRHGTDEIAKLSNHGSSLMSSLEVAESLKLYTVDANTLLQKSASAYVTYDPVGNETHLNLEADAINLIGGVSVDDLVIRNIDVTHEIDLKYGALRSAGRTNIQNGHIPYERLTDSPSYDPSRDKLSVGRIDVGSINQVLEIDTSEATNTVALGENTKLLSSDGATLVKENGKIPFEALEVPEAITKVIENDAPGLTVGDDYKLEQKPVTIDSHKLYAFHSIEPAGAVVKLTFAKTVDVAGSKYDLTYDQVSDLSRIIQDAVDRSQYLTLNAYNTVPVDVIADFTHRRVVARFHAPLGRASDDTYSFSHHIVNDNTISSVRNSLVLDSPNVSVQGSLQINGEQSISTDLHVFRFVGNADGTLSVIRFDKGTGRNVPLVKFGT